MHNLLSLILLYVCSACIVKNSQESIPETTAESSEESPVDTSATEIDTTESTSSEEDEFEEGLSEEEITIEIEDGQGIGEI